MTQHYRLPSIENHTAMAGINRDGLVADVSIQMRLKTDDLRQYDGWNGPSKQYLEAAGDHIDVRGVITDYYTHISSFYDWFDARQRELHGIGPDLLRHLSVHGVSGASRAEVAELAEGITALESKPSKEVTLADIESAFAPVLSVVDMRRLMLCSYDGRVWIRTALSAAQSRFNIPTDLQARIRALIQ